MTFDVHENVEEENVLENVLENAQENAVENAVENVSMARMIQACPYSSQMEFSLGMFQVL